MPQKDDLSTLSPSPIEVKIGDRTYTQKPLTLRRTSLLVGAFSEEMQKASTSPALTQLLNQDIDEPNAAANLAPMLIQVLSTIPHALERIITIVLTGEEEKTELDYVADNCSPVQAMRIMRTFIEQNDPGELIENFIYLRSMFGDAMNRAKEKLNE